MNLSDIAIRIDGQVLTATGERGQDVDRVFASDRMSDLLAKASSNTLLVSRLSSCHLLRVAQLMDIPGICLAGGVPVAPELVRGAEAQGTVLMASALASDDICRRLSPFLVVEKGVSL